MACFRMSSRTHFRGHLVLMLKVIVAAVLLAAGHVRAGEAPRDEPLSLDAEPISNDFLQPVDTVSDVPLELGALETEDADRDHPALTATSLWEFGEPVGDSWVHLAQAQEAVTPTPPAPFSDSIFPPDLLAASGLDPSAAGSLFGFNGLGAFSVVIPPTSAGVTTDSPTITRNASGLSQGNVVPTRTPIVHGTIIRGRRLGQVPGRGSYWFPARQDLDTTLSKIDSDLVRQVTTIKGPYSALYGPGLAFYNLELQQSPRFENGYESHGSTGIEYQTNGDQWNGRQRLWGGSSNWGYRVGYGHRTGSDYDTGAGGLIPASYKSRNPFVALGADLTDDSRIEFSYLRLDQTDVEFAGQVFDMDFLVTDGYDLRYVQENHAYFDRLVLETWYNRTRFAGDNLRPGKRRQVPILDMFLQNPFNPGDFGSLVATTDVDAMSTGFRLAMSWGEPGFTQVTTGVDLRYLKQQLNEFSAIAGFNPPLPPIPPFDTPPFTGPQNKPIPRSHSSNPGLFIEGVTPVNDRLVVRAGARVDWVSTNADQTAPGTFYLDLTGNPTDNLEDVLLGEFDQHFNLWSAFLSAEYEVNHHWRAIAGAGHAMRPPTMTELYAVQPFLAVLPQFLFNAPLGNPNLDPEELWQIDLGLQGEYQYARGGIHGYYGWVHDYITFDNITFSGPGAPALGITYVNTKRATLAGGEVYGELDLTRWLKSFAVASYVEGRDHTRTGSNSPFRNTLLPGTNRSNSAVQKEPLPVMPPLESRLGLILHEPCANPNWSVEFAARVVDNQDRAAFVTLGEQFTPGFTTYDINAFARLTERLFVRGGVLNFTDKNYREHFDPRPATLSGNFFQPGIAFYFASEIQY